MSRSPWTGEFPIDRDPLDDHAAAILLRNLRAGCAPRWVALPAERSALLGDGDACRVRDQRGEVRGATYERSPGGGHGFYDDAGDPIDVTAIEIT